MGTTGATATTGDAGTTGDAAAGTTGDGGASTTGAPTTTGIDASLADAGDSGDDGAAGDAGDAGEEASVPTFPPCEGGDPGPCGSFVTPTGDEIELGPYGASVEVNVGAGFENPVAAGDSVAFICQQFAASFGEGQESTDRLLDTDDLDFALYTVYHPARWVEGETYPLLAWGNGTCAQPEGYSALLRYVASHGFIVVAPNSRWVGDGSEQVQAIDYAMAANEDSDSFLHGKVDTENVGAMGHSQGAGGTAAASSDPRVDAVILFNGGTSADKPFLALSGDFDIGDPTAEGFGGDVLTADEAAFIFFHMVPETGGSSGHLTLMTQPERVIEPTVAWFKYQLLGDGSARDFFVEPVCHLCGNDAEYEYGSVGLQ